MVFFSEQLSQQYFVEIRQQFLWTALTAIFWCASALILSGQLFKAIFW
jgi:hypothetical protein